MSTIDLELLAQDIVSNIDLTVEGSLDLCRSIILIEAGANKVDEVVEKILNIKGNK
jgi:hypothetical protein